jgi:hypothetical protein
MTIHGTTFTIDTRDAEFAATFKDIGKSLENPAEFFGRRWYLSHADLVTGHEGFHAVYIFQRLEEVKGLSE